MRKNKNQKELLILLTKVCFFFRKICSKITKLKNYVILLDKNCKFMIEEEGKIC